MRRRRLKIPDPHEISLVRRGANLKKFLVHKSDEAPAAASLLADIIAKAEIGYEGEDEPPAGATRKKKKRKGMGDEASSGIAPSEVNDPGSSMPGAIAKSGDWDESKHPRGAGGKFGSGGGDGGKKPKSEGEKRAEAKLGRMSRAAKREETAASHAASEKTMAGLRRQNEAIQAGREHHAAAKEAKSAGDKAMMNLDHEAAAKHYEKAADHASKAIAAHQSGKNPEGRDHAQDVHAEAHRGLREAKAAVEQDKKDDASRAKYGDTDPRTSSGKVIPDAESYRGGTSADMMTHDDKWSAQDHADAAKHFYAEGHHGPAREHEKEAARLSSVRKQLDEEQEWVVREVYKHLGEDAAVAVLEGYDPGLPANPTEDQVWVVERVKKAFGKGFPPRPAPNPRTVQAMQRQPAPLQQPPPPAPAPVAPGPLPATAYHLVPAQPLASQPVTPQQAGAPPVSPAADIAHPVLGGQPPVAGAASQQLPLAAGGGLSSPAQDALKACARILAPRKDEISAQDIAGMLEAIGIPVNEAPDEEALDEDEDAEDGGDDEEQEGEGDEESATAAVVPGAPRQQPLDGKPEYVALSLETNHDEVDPMPTPDLSAFSPSQRESLQAVIKSLETAAEEKAAAANKELIEKNAELQKRLDAQDDARTLREYVAKAEEFDHLGAKPDKMAVILKTLNDKSPELREELEAVLKGVNGQLAINDEFGGLMSEQGSRQSGGGGSAAQAKLDAMVEGYVAKSENAGLSRQQITTRILKTAEGKRLAREIDQENERKKRRFGAA